MKASRLPVLALPQFPQPLAAQGCYAERLERHVARYPHVNEPHAHDFYLLLYLTQGGGQHTVDLVSYELRPGSVFFLAPGQVHHWVLAPDTEGYVVFFSADFYLFRYPGSRLYEYPFFAAQHAPVLYLPQQHEAAGPAETELLPLLERLQAETHGPPQPNSADVARSYLYLFLELAARRYPAAAPAEAKHGVQQVREFGALLNQHYRTLRTVQEYAKLLHLTPNHLNAVCRRVLNKTASALIHERVVTEAQRLLTHSAGSVAEVGYALGFEDASYFTRYFRKYTGRTPEAFRQQP
ncbi:helix-turn-helix domain-containing protein [Hymenobacter busanensis]|uniref:Helix-turn-helix domain-containing protein n=1 Tax=Hymenobacter busanensis TaxID=2607656 RepID=A0A7L5A4X5_9BACT|nr:helix-turn-helix domain-containing protein [Hymenobacter busanensis]KAA9338195.1 helix-turn-helix domain-containing protein [Hymenobacter busanensis]QHJ09380.1 helix-turn-helix domain-containing protein [Hymenobacter busanensis]